MSAVSPIARDGHWRRNILVNRKLAFARLTTEIVRATPPTFKQEYFNIGRLVESVWQCCYIRVLKSHSRSLETALFFTWLIFLCSSMLIIGVNPANNGSKVASYVAINDIIFHTPSFPLFLQANYTE